MRLIIRMLSLFFLLYFILIMVPLNIGKEVSNEGDIAKLILDKILDTRSKVENFKCLVVYHNYRPRNTQKDRLEELTKQGLPQKYIDSMISNIDNISEYEIQKHRLAFDNEGRARVEMINGESDINWNLIEVNSMRISTWDGENSIQYGEKLENVIPSAIINNKQPFETSERIRQPWRQFGGNFYDHLSKAIADGRQINIKREKDDKYHIEIIYENAKKNVIVDPSCGYSVVQQENYFNGQLSKRCKAKFAEVSPGIWFPIEGEDIRFSRDDIKIPKLKSIIKVSEITINDPNFYEDLFHVNFTKGTRVIDNISGLRYVVGEPMSEKIQGIPDAQSLHEVAMDTLEEITEETYQNHDFELFIPRIGIALEKGESFVLSLSYGKFVNPRNNPESEESNKFLTELGKGDICWNSTVVTARGAKVLTIKQESERPLKLTKGKWTNSYELPEKVELPYSMLVVTNEGVNYLLKIKKIESGGITITYRELNPDELILYK